MHHLQEELRLPPESVLPILRVIQECITNTLKHAHAKTIEVGAQSGAQQVLVFVRDDGLGFDVQSIDENDRGNGLRNLRKRAKSLDAVLDVKSSAHGTQVQLKVPLI